MTEIIGNSKNRGCGIDRWLVDSRNGTMAARNAVWKVSPGCDCNIETSPTRLQSGVFQTDQTTFSLSV